MQTTDDLVLWQLVHREFGPIAAFDTQNAAEHELSTVLSDEPSWADTLNVQPFRVTGTGA